MTALRDEVRRAADAALTDVADLRRYWLDTQTAWEIVDESAAPDADPGPGPGGAAAFSSTPERRRELAGRADVYLQRYLAAAVIKGLYTAFDAFLLDLFRRWLRAHPRHLLRSGRGQKTRQLSLETVVAAPNRGAVIDAVVEREVRDVAYLSLADQFDALRRLVALDRPADGERAALTELKATRDLLTHGDGVVGAAYLAASGPLARFAAGERMQLPDVYLAASFDLVRTVVAATADAARLKAADAPARG